jgi:microcystin-dependent protein
MFAGNFAPKNWAFCNGQLLPVAQYPALFQILSNTYGGDGKTTFGLPNLQGRAVVSAGQGESLYKLGQSGGSEAAVMTSYQMPSHTHQLGVQLSPNAAATSNSASPDNACYATSASSLYNYTENTPLQSYQGNLTLANTGYNPLNTPTPIPYLHPVVVLNCIICLSGQMP